MSENPKYRKMFDDMRRNDLGTDHDASQGSTENESEFYDKISNVRNVCFSWPDGRKLFLNYAYLVSGELVVDDEANIISLKFTSTSVTMKGYRLNELFDSFMKQTVQTIIQGDKRYKDGTEGFLVVEIEVFDPMQGLSPDEAA